MDGTVFDGLINGAGRGRSPVAASRELLVALSAILGLVTGCSPAASEAGDRARWYDYIGGDDHLSKNTRSGPNPAAALSLGSPASLGTTGPLDTAINCTVALRTTLGLLREMGGVIGETERRAFQQAEAEYTRRAIEIGIDEGQPREGTLTVIEDRYEIYQDQTSTLPRLAIACLQNLGA